ncbi:hypothetical protein HPP92_015925 [Vanilla planifolia]|uniref:non-specific serine/threonine protein kinase n=1 Tax=Vanilla planifolia TaxID=51239 RepID=A0A835UU52_VANPL|nr:hypothetical protein HPP92_015925 [Vanilla planifolia]
MARAKRETWQILLKLIPVEDTEGTMKSLGRDLPKLYRAFDEYEGIEVAWNQVKLHNFLQSPDDLERLYCEIHLLKTLKHKNIMKFYTSWVDTSRRNINFITEMFTSGTLRQQILMGLVYLHGHDPPVIHKGLKCDNIFINGNQGEVKIGDVGLVAFLPNSRASHFVGTPEFMVYEDEYNESVDIYSFGMCVLEMFSIEYPYTECAHPAQIYQKVVSGTKPNALYRVKNPEVRRFVEKCMMATSLRLPALELLNDPFLQIEIGHKPWLQSLTPQLSNNSLMVDEFVDDELETHHSEIFSFEEDHFANMDITIKGRRKEDGGVFLRLRIADKYGRVRNIYFSFDVEADTALSVATEMVAELDIDEYEVTRIAEMIDDELSTLVPDWKTNSLCISSSNLCQNCASNVSSHGSIQDHLALRNLGGGNLQPLHCSNLECAAMHGRFEEITYRVEGLEDFDTRNALRGTCPLGEDDHLCSSNIEAMVNRTNDDLEKLSNPNELPWLDAKNLVMQREDKAEHAALVCGKVDREIRIGRSDRSLFCKSSKDGKMKSFHLATNRTFRVPRDREEMVPDVEGSSVYANSDACFSSSNPERSTQLLSWTASFYGNGPSSSPMLRTKSLPVNEAGG